MKVEIRTDKIFGKKTRKYDTRTMEKFEEVEDLISALQKANFPKAYAMLVEYVGNRKTNTTALPGVHITISTARDSYYNTYCKVTWLPGKKKYRVEQRHSTFVAYEERIEGVLSTVQALFEDGIDARIKQEREERSWKVDHKNQEERREKIAEQVGEISTDTEYSHYSFATDYYGPENTDGSHTYKIRTSDNFNVSFELAGPKVKARYATEEPLYILQNVLAVLSVEEMKALVEIVCRCPRAIADKLM